MPEEEKKSGLRELRMFINARGGEKIRLKGIERAHQCPRRRKNQAQGNREGSSMTEEEKKSGLRELRMFINARGGEKSRLKGIEKTHRQPRRRKNNSPMVIGEIQ